MLDLKLEQIELLYDYTKWHLGLYLVAATPLVAAITTTVVDPNYIQTLP